MNRITELFKIEKPIIQAGMVWCSGWKLASAVSEAGGLGIIGAGSMYPDVLQEHITKYRAVTSKPFAVNLPLLYPAIDQHIATIIKEKVPIVFTSAGNPNTWTAKLKQEGITIVHVVSSEKFALKAQDAGVDAIVAEGFEAGGHNGREETTTLCLIPMISKAVNIPVIAAGGIASGEAMLATMILGAEGVQIGSLFASSKESSAHDHFKEQIVKTGEGETELSMKKVTPVRLIKNEFYNRIKKAELKGAEADELKGILGKGRAKLGMFEGDLENGELEIGQVSAMIQEVKSAKEIVDEIWKGYLNAKKKIFMRPLKKGDEIILISTARKVHKGELSHAIEILESWGLSVLFGQNIFKEDNQFAGSDKHRSEDLQWALDHPNAKAILCTRGGYGTSRIIDTLNFEAFQTNPKWLIGFSDITILHQHINSLGFPSIHGTMPLLFSNEISVKSLKDALFNSSYQVQTNSHPFNKAGEVSGELVGGNLTLLIHGLASSSEIDTQGKILFIEEIDEYLYHIDRMILQLKRAGKLSGLKALIVGGFSSMNDNTIPFGKASYEIIEGHIQEFNYPVCYDFPAGHVDENHALIFGKKVRLTISNEHSSLIY